MRLQDSAARAAARRWRAHALPTLPEGCRNSEQRQQRRNCGADETQRVAVIMPDQQKMPDVVYHYTSMETLLKIVDSGAIWATNIQYLNDVLEYTHYLSLIEKLLLQKITRELTASPEPDPVDEALYNILKNNRASKPFYELPFVASFSHDRDSLPQWRSYCPQGNGVCVGFRTDSLQKASVGNPSGDDEFPVLPLVGVSFEPVLYLDPKDNNKIETLFESATREALAWEKEDKEAQDGSEEEVPGVYLWGSIRRQASRIKHASFEPENEYRLLVTTFRHLDATIQYRTSRSTLIPYIPVRIPSSMGSRLKPARIPGSEESKLYSRRRRFPAYLTRYFIESVVIGPTPHLALSADALNGFFDSRRLDVKIETSIVPFRDL
jgi:hypothetical protein